MELIKSIWTDEDKQEFLELLTSLKNPQKIQFTSNIINTRLPLLAIPVPELRKIASKISKGNFISFLEANINNYYEAVFINGLLICKIKDFNSFKKWLTRYAKHVDNWACCDSLQFKINSHNIQNYFKLSKKMFASSYDFERRIAVRIWFKMINTEYINTIFDLINTSSETEQSYYVNMVIAWFLSECYILNRFTTLQFLENNKLNDFTLRKFVSKCQDSYRISTSDKMQLKSLLH